MYKGRRKRSFKRLKVDANYEDINNSLRNMPNSYPAHAKAISEALAEVESLQKKPPKDKLNSELPGISSVYRARSYVLIFGATARCIHSENSQTFDRPFSPTKPSSCHAIL
jgi:hypothetical protein